MKRKLAGAAITMVVAALAAGCGGGDDDGTTTTAAEPLPKAEFITRADQICGATRQQIQAAATRLRNIGSKSGTLAVPLVAQFIEQTELPAYDAMLDKIRALQAPEQDAKTIDGYVAAVANAIDTVKADPAKYSTNKASDPFADANARARAYGLKVCGAV